MLVSLISHYNEIQAALNFCLMTDWEGHVDLLTIKYKLHEEILLYCPISSQLPTSQIKLPLMSNFFALTPPTITR